MNTFETRALPLRILVAAAIVLISSCGGGGAPLPVIPAAGPKPTDLLSSSCVAQLGPAAGFLGSSAPLQGSAPGALVAPPSAGAITFTGACTSSVASPDASGQLVSRTVRISGVAATAIAMAAGGDYVATVKYEERNSAGVLLREYLTSGDHTLRLLYADGKSYRFAINSALLQSPRVGGGLQLTGQFDVVNP